MTANQHLGLPSKGIEDPELSTSLAAPEVFELKFLSITSLAVCFYSSGFKPRADRTTLPT